MQLVVDPSGNVKCIYSEAIELTALGSPTIRRASHVEPDQADQWVCDLSPVGGPRLGPFDARSQALTAEQEWLASNWLGKSV